MDEDNFQLLLRVVEVLDHLNNELDQGKTAKAKAADLLEAENRPAAQRLARFDTEEKMAVGGINEGQPGEGAGEVNALKRTLTMSRLNRPGALGSKKSGSTRFGGMSGKMSSSFSIGDSPSRVARKSKPRGGLKKSGLNFIVKPSSSIDEGRRVSVGAVPLREDLPTEKLQQVVDDHVQFVARLSQDVDLKGVKFPSEEDEAKAADVFVDHMESRGWSDAEQQEQSEDEEEEEVDEDTFSGPEHRSSQGSRFSSMAFRQSLKFTEEGEEEEEEEDEDDGEDDMSSEEPISLQPSAASEDVESGSSFEGRGAVDEEAGDVDLAQMCDDPLIMKQVLDKILNMLNEEMEGKVARIINNLVEDELNLRRITQKYEEATAQNDEQHEENQQLQSLVTTLQSKLASTTSELNRLREVAGEMKEVKTQLEEAEKVKEVEMERVRKETRKQTIHMVKLNQAAIKFEASDTGLESARSGKQTDRDSNDDAVDMDEAEAVLAALGGGRRSRKSVGLTEPMEDRARTSTKKPDAKALQAELAKLKEENEVLNEDLEAAQKSVSRYQVEVAGLREEVLMLTAKNLEMADAETERQRLTQEIEHKETAIRQMIEEMGQLEDQVGDLISEKKKLLKQIEQTAREMDIIKADVQKYATEGGANPVELREKELQLIKVTEEVDALRKLIEELEQNQNNLRSELDALTSGRSQAEAELALLRSRLNGATKALEAMTELQEKETRAEAEIQRLRQAINERDEEIIKLKEDLAKLTSQSTTSQEELVSLHSFNKSLKTQLQAIATEINTLRKTVAARDRELLALKAFMDSPDREEIRHIKRLSEELESVKRDLDDCRMDLLTSQALTEGLRRSLKETENTLETERKTRRDLEPIYLPPNPQHKAELTRARHLIGELRARISWLEKRVELYRQPPSLCSALMRGCTTVRTSEPKQVSPTVLTPSPQYLYPKRNAQGLTPQPPKQKTNGGDRADSHRSDSHRGDSHRGNSPPTPLIPTPQSLLDAMLSPAGTPAKIRAGGVHASTPRIRLPSRVRVSSTQPKRAPVHTPMRASAEVLHRSTPQSVRSPPWSDPRISPSPLQRILLQQSQQQRPQRSWTSSLT